MKSLIMKDLYNIAHNSKSMLVLLLLFAVFLIPIAGYSSYIIVCGILCSMMVVTTFAFDDNCKWTRYAMVMPVSKKDVVLSKFIVLIIFCAFGSLFGLVFGTVGGIITHTFISKGEGIDTLLFLTPSAAPENLSMEVQGIAILLLLTLVAFVIAVVFGSISIPLTIKFGAEKARMMLLISYLVPIGICLVIYQVLLAFGVVLTDQAVFGLLCASPLLALIWIFIMYKISYNIFLRKEF